MKQKKLIPALVLVDLQVGYINLGNPCLDVAEALLIHAIASEWPVIELEDKGGMNTHECLTRHLRKYPHVAYQKDRWDGSMQVSWACNDKGFPTDCFLVLGAYGSECVRATVGGLADLFPGTVAIVTDGCTNLNDKPCSAETWQWVSHRSTPNNICLTNSARVKEVCGTLIDSLSVHDVKRILQVSE